eukprot:2055359-Lingulodinium_polyedra.AAC.1
MRVSAARNAQTAPNTLPLPAIRRDPANIFGPTMSQPFEISISQLTQPIARNALETPPAPEK